MVRCFLIPLALFIRSTGLGGTGCGYRASCSLGCGYELQGNES